MSGAIFQVLKRNSSVHPNCFTSSGIRKRAAGFTLLEILVAIGIFSVVAMISYATLDTYLDQRERLTEHYGRLERLQRLFILLGRDVQFVAPRGVQIGDDLEPAVLGPEAENLLTMTVALPDVNSATGASLKRVQWRLQGKELIRAQWDVLDHTGQAKPAELLVSEEVDDIELLFWMTTPNQGVDTRTSLEKNEFPAGIEVSVTLSNGQRYRRLYAIAQGG